MKNSVIILNALFLVSPSLRAQKINIGIKAGATIASPYVSITENGVSLANPTQKIKPGYYGGIFFNFPTFSERLHIQTEVLFIKSGSSFDSSNYNRAGSLSIQQLQVPLMAQYRVLPNFKLNLGVYAGAVLGVKEIVEGIPNDFAIFDYNDLDYGLLGGLEYRFSNKWSLNTRVQLGIKDLILSHPTFVGQDVDYQTQTLNIGINYLLGNSQRNNYESNRY